MCDSSRRPADCYTVVADGLNQWSLGLTDPGHTGLTDLRTEPRQLASVFVTLHEVSEVLPCECLGAAISGVSV